jgi:hypothetical protein
MILRKKNQKYTLKEVSEAYNLGTTTLRDRCKYLGFKPENSNGCLMYLLNLTQIKMVINFRDLNYVIIPEIVYINTVYEIRESKMNYL